jgi:type I restriction enzyme, S subunit
VLDRSRALATLDAIRILRGEGSTSGTTQFGSHTVSVPDGWRVTTVGAEATIVEYGTSAKATSEQSPESVPVLRMGNLFDGHLVLDKLKYFPRTHADLPRLLLQPGDLLFNRTNSAELVGKSAVFDLPDRAMTFASYLIRVRFGPRVRPAWANLVINSAFGRAHIATVASQQVGQANVNGTKLKAIPLLVPPLDDQDRLLAHHDELVGSAQRLASEVTRTRARTEGLRQALLHAAFSGQLSGSSNAHERAEELAGV